MMSDREHLCDSAMRVGVARIDITPDEPIRLCGYAVREGLSEGVEQPISAKALAIASEGQAPAVLLSVELTAVSEAMVEHLARRLFAKAGVVRERFVVCCTHTHTGPCVEGTLPNMFGRAIPAAHREGIGRYTRELMKRLERVMLSAVEAMQPARLGFGAGSVSFGGNRRPQGGPVDGSLPVLAARDRAGGLLAVVANYACHCTTLGTFNRVCGDWAGYAQEAIEAAHGGSTSLMTIGCGADTNPLPRGQLDQAKAYGRQVAAEVQRVLSGDMMSLGSGPVCRMSRIELPFERVPDRSEWEERARRDDAAGYHARQFLSRLDGGQEIPGVLPYTVQVWSFGGVLTMVFLAGEVVVDYALRLKAERPAERLWITAYANGVPCYIPSARVLREGGYEAEESMLYYGQPGRLAEAVEEKVLHAVQALMENAGACASRDEGADHG